MKKRSQFEDMFEEAVRDRLCGSFIGGISDGLEDYLYYQLTSRLVRDAIYRVLLMELRND